jgi:Mrp family chromosome partitioning ATPase
MRHMAGTESMPGLTDYIAGTADTASLIQRDASTGIDFIAAGPTTSRAFGPEEIARLRDLVNKMKQIYQMIVIDSPPLLAMTDGFVYASIADQTVFVCRWQRSSRQAVMAALERLRAYGAQVAGVVVTMVDKNAALQFDGEYGRRERQLITRLYGS